jgi:dihydrofolate reductase
MSGPQCIEGYAIVSADGMIADADGKQPPELIVKADQQFFRRGLDRAEAVLHGRFSHEQGAGAETRRGADKRRRLVLTRRIEAIAPHPRHSKGLLWNPAGASLEEAWRALGLDGGTLAVIGGTEPFGLFLDTGYDAFHLTRANRARLPGGRPVFPGVPQRTPEDLLASHGLRPGPTQMLDPEMDATLVTWYAAEAAPSGRAS